LVCVAEAISVSMRASLPSVPPAVSNPPGFVATSVCFALTFNGPTLGAINPANLSAVGATTAPLMQVIDVYLV
jgi:hypothetical protein